MTDETVSSIDIQTYFSPDDDTTQAFLDFVNGAQKCLHVAIYGLHLPSFIDAVMALQARGVPTYFVIDHTQARGTYERPEIEQLRKAGFDVAEGTSEKHKIMHHKFIVRDMDTVLSGSWNFSMSASEESNYFDVIKSPERATAFLAKWKEMHDWIEANEQKYQS